MAVIPQVVTSDRATGAQVIDGSLKFDDNYLTRTPSSGGNRKTWTWSAWIKPDRVSGNLQQLFEAKLNGTKYDALYFTSGQALEYESYYGSQQAVKITNRIFRDTGWYHIVVNYDAGNSTADDRIRIYVNGERETSFSSSTNPDQTDNTYINGKSIVHQIGDGQASNQEYDGRMSQVYLIDGQALGPENFGFTDPLTNTWKPKKYEGDFNVGDTSQTDYVSGFDGQSLSDTDTAFDSFTGYTGGDGYSQTQGSTVTYTAPGDGIAYSSTIRLFCKHGSGGPNSITVDGNSFTPSTGSSNNSGAWNDISSYVTGNKLNTIVTTRGYA